MNKELHRADLHKKIDEIFDLSSPLTIFVHLDGQGNYKLESKLGHNAMMQDGCIEAINKIITNNTEQK